MIYLDNAATTLVKPEAVGIAVKNAVNSLSSPGRGAYASSLKAAETVHECREVCAELFNVPDSENIVFTSNATHSLNVAINSLVEHGSKVLVSGFEHNSVTRPLKALGADIIVAGRKLFDCDDTLKEFTEKIKNSDAVVCTHVSNAFGYVLPIYEIARLCRAYSKPLIVDASQSAGILSVDFQRLGAEFIAMPGHKGLYGPQGTGVLLCKDVGRPLMSGGSGSDSINQSMPEFLPDVFEAGTQNVCGIAGLLEGIKYIKSISTEYIEKYEKKLIHSVIDELKGCEGLEIFAGNSQSGVLSLRPRNIDCESLADELGELGICVRSGLHCAPYAHRSAGTIETGTVRISVSAFTAESSVVYAADCIKEILRKKC